MGSIYHFPTAAAAQARLLEQLINESIAEYPDEAVARRWGAMARETIARYASPPVPSQPLLDLDAVPGLTSDQTRQIGLLVEQWLQNYFNDVRYQLMDVHKDLFRLQKRVAELEARVET